MRWVRASRELAWFGLFAALTILMTWPWICHIRDAASDPGDPFTDSWILAWDFHQTFHDPLHLFDGNIFYPARKSLAFLENMYGVALPLFPLFLFGLRPLTVHGIAELLAYALCGYGMFRLTRTATGSTPAAIIAGIVFAFIPFRFGHIMHLPMVSSVWIPLTLEAIFLFIHQRTWPRAAWLGVAYFFNGLSSIHWLVLTLLPLPLAFFLLMWAKDLLRERGLWIKATLAIAAALLMLLPFLLPYRAVAKEYNFIRSREENLFFSAQPSDWLVAPNRVQLYRSMRPSDRTIEKCLFPGLETLLLVGATVFLARKRRPPSGSSPARIPPARSLLHALDLIAIFLFAALVYGAVSGALQAGSRRPSIFTLFYGNRAIVLLFLVVTLRWWLRLPAAFGGGAKGIADHLRESERPEVWVAWSWAVMGFFGSLGMNFEFHRLLYKYLFVFRSIRAPARWANIAYVGLALLAGIGAMALVERVTRRRLKWALIGLLAVAILFEFRVAPLELVRGEAEPPPVYLAVKQLPMKGGLVELPINDFVPYYSILRAADHFKPVLTAVEDDYGDRIKRLTRQRPIPEILWAELETIPISYLIVHEELLTPDEQPALHQAFWRAMQANRLRFIKRFEGGLQHRDDLYAIVVNEPDAESREALPWLPPVSSADSDLSK